MADVRFTRTWEDRSDHRGLRFEFRCERCHSGYSSSTIPGDARMAGAWDRALGLAVEQMERDVFVRCEPCGQWVCAPRCWNHTERACTGCRPQQAVPPQPQYGHQPQTAHPPHHRQAQPQSVQAATQAWAPDMRAELQEMLQEPSRQPAQQPRPAPQERSVQASTEAWAPDMQAELKAMLNQAPPPQRPAAHGAPEPQFVPKFCSQCGSALTGRFCGRCGNPAY